MHQIGQIYLAKSDATRHGPGEEGRVVDGTKKIHRTTGACYNVSLGGENLHQSGQRPQFSCQICGRQLAPADENPAETLAFPKANCHVTIGALILKFHSKTLLSRNLLCKVAHGTVKKMLEYGLKLTKIFENWINYS